jgi:glycosyltransferase involved in cell wall biosynthesis
VAGRRTGQDAPLLVFDEHNAEYVLQQRAFETDRQWSGSIGRKQVKRWIGAAYSFIQWQRLERYERQACLAADRVVAVSETDAQVLRNLVPGLEPLVVPNGVDMELHMGAVPPLPTGSGPGEQDLVFTGKMDFRPNVDAVLWFAREVLPLIRRGAPEVRLWVVGMNPHPRLAALADDPAVEITGWVEHVRPFIAAAAIYVVPLRIGGGTRLKILQAMAMGKAIVSTGLGCEGFDVVPGQEMVIADTPDEFASATLALLSDPDRRQRLGHAARSLAGSKYDWQIIVPQMEEAYAGRTPAP